MSRWLCKIINWYFPYKSKTNWSSVQTHWPELLRVFILVNYLYFTYFVFSLLWSFIKHSVSTRTLCLRAEHRVDSIQSRCETDQQCHGNPFTFSCQGQNHCKIGYSLQKLKRYNEKFYSFWKDKVEDFYNSLALTKVLLNNYNESIKQFGIADTADNKDENLSQQSKIRQKHPDPFIKSSNKEKPADQCIHYDTYYASSKRDKTHFADYSHLTPKKAECHKNIKFKANGCKDKVDRMQHPTMNDDRVESEKSEIKRYCSDCNKIEFRGCKHNSCRKKNHGKRHERTCKVLYYGPYASKKRNTVSKYTIQNGDNKVSDFSGEENSQQGNKLIVSSRETKCKSRSHHTKERSKKGKEQKNISHISSERENRYFSEEECSEPSRNCSRVLLGTPLSKIDPKAKNFMPKNTVKHVYKSPIRKSDVNQNLAEIVSQAIRKVSKSMRHERQYYYKRRCKW
ncbi:hypothetical protein M8J75_000830 [Diaphorina citri]|nr:hypothetical protein M8J75_000830 [Diaphorina citri]